MRREALAASQDAGASKHGPDGRSLRLPALGIELVDNLQAVLVVPLLTDPGEPVLRCERLCHTAVHSGPAKYAGGGTGHPCFCGGFADRSDLEAVVIRPGYLDGHWTKASWTDKGVRAKVGATHRPLPELMHAFLNAGLTLERFAESGEPIPVVLAVRARKPFQQA